MINDLRFGRLPYGGSGGDPFYEEAAEAPNQFT